MGLHKRLLAAIAIISIGVSAVFPSPGAQAGEGAAALKPVEPADLPEVTFTDGADAARSSKEFAGRALLVHGWATWCVPCVKELPEVAELQKKYKDKGLVVLAISLDTDPKKVTDFYAKQNITGLPVYLDKKAQMMRSLKIRGLPSSILVNKEGKMVFNNAGPVDWQSKTVQEQIEALLK